jgi:CDP-glucose 4,6-dehydratase
MDRGFWSGKRVFITGHTGFKGSWLSLWLQSLGSHLFGYSLDHPSKPCLFDLADVASGMTSLQGDIRDRSALASAMVASQCEIVLHLAAQSLVRRSYHDPIETYSTNVMGTANVLDAARTCRSVRVVIIVTSDKCYENREQEAGYRETDPMGGFDPYSSSKGCAELITAAWRNSYFHPDRHAEHNVAISSARAGNVIGGGDWAEDRLIPDIMNAFHSGEPVSLRNPASIRPWQFVLDSLSGYLLLAERMWENGKSYSSAWNFGPDLGAFRSVEWLTRELAMRWGTGARINLDTSSHPHEARLLALDCGKARERLKWSTSQPLEITLDWIIDWYKAYFSASNVRSLTLDQIQRYR